MTTRMTAPASAVAVAGGRRRRAPVPAADGGGMGARGAGGNDRGPLRESRCDRVVRLQQRASHAAGGLEGTECVGPARHALERVGVGAGSVREPSRCQGDGSPWFWVGRAPCVPGRQLAQSRGGLPGGESRQPPFQLPRRTSRLPRAEDCVVALRAITLLPPVA